MADIEIGYKGSTIASINSGGVTTLNTIGTFCEDNITVTFNKTYPTFNVTWSNDQSSILSVTCDKTYQYCYDLYNNDHDERAAAIVHDQANTETYYQVGSVDAIKGNNDINYVIASGAHPNFDLIYHQNGTISAVYPSSRLISLTPTATKGVVSNNAINITPSVTVGVRGGFVSGGTSTGTPVSVAASELVSGTLSITSNGTHDVTNYASATVNVSGGGNEFLVTFTKSGNGWVPDKTFSQTYSAYTNGKTICSLASNNSSTMIVYDDDNDGFYVVIEEFFNDFNGSQYYNWGVNVYGYVWTSEGFEEDENSRRYATDLGTALPSDVTSGKVFYNTAGIQIGTASGGGGGEAVTEKQVNFIDYDGTLLHSYTKSEAEALTALPSNPTHSGLVAQGWNWTLAEIKAQLTAIPDGPVWVGQMYITESGDTEIDCEFPEGRLSPIMSICVKGTVTIDWGDNTAVTTVTGTSLSTRQESEHTYAAAGAYTIKIHVVSGTYRFHNTTTYALLRKKTTTLSAENQVYINCVKAARLGSGISSIGNYAFYNCRSLTSITIPSGVTSINTYAFNLCFSVKSITIPRGVTSISANVFDGCRVLNSVSIPSGVSSIADSAFRQCYSLPSITIPSGVTSIGSYIFYYCYSLTSLTLPSGVTTIGSYCCQQCVNLKNINKLGNITAIGSYAFDGCSALSSITIPTGVTSIGNYAFNNCQVLTSITIPESVTSIGTYVFQSDGGMAEYHFLPTTPPTLSNTNAFQSIPSDCIIYVPSESLEDYQTATNWSTYASYMVGE